MAKTATLDRTVSISVKVNPEAKAGAEQVLNNLGISMSTAIDMFLRQIKRTRKVPLSLSIEDEIWNDDGPDSINAAKMSPREIAVKMYEAYDDIQNGRVMDAETAFNEFRRTHNGFDK